MADRRRRRRHGIVNGNVRDSKYVATYRSVNEIVSRAALSPYFYARFTAAPCHGRPHMHANDRRTSPGVNIVVDRAAFNASG